MIDLLSALALALLLALGLLGSISERRRWNSGICKENGLPWVHFDTDSQGGRGYKAGNCSCWISWPYIDGR